MSTAKTDIGDVIAYENGYTKGYSDGYRRGRMDGESALRRKIIDAMSWDDDEARIDRIGQNGGDGAHYLPCDVEP